MKIYYGGTGLLLSGKVWEIQEKLKDCTKDYQFVKELLRDHQKCTPSFYDAHR
ncbi:Z-ring formation inhibitor MciZ [Bacillus benzoevorans]